MSEFNDHRIEKSISCSHRGCQFKKHEDNDKCIFHCNKDDWYDIVNQKKVWKVTEVKKYWEEFRLNVRQDRYILLVDYVFPEFECYFSYGNKYKNYSFFEKNDERIFKINENLLFRNCTFLGKVKLDNITFKNKVSFIVCYYDDEFSLSNNTFEGDINFTFCTFKSRTFFCKNTFTRTSKLNYINNKYIGRFVSRDISGNNLRVKFNMEEFYENSVVDFTNVNVKSICFEEFYNYSKVFKITNLKVSDNFAVKNSNFDKVSFNNCNFNATRRIFLRNVSFDGLRLDNIKWGNIDSKHFKANRDTIRNLKHENDNQGNYIEANKFYALEMDKYSQEIKSSKNYIEKIVFLISKKISNFSQDWTLPVYWYFFISSLFLDVLILKDFQDYSYLAGTTAIIYAFKILLLIRIFKSIESWVKYSWLFLAFNYIFYISINCAGLISINDIFWFFNLFGIKTIDADLLTNVLFMIHKLIVVFIGYHLVTALRFHTRRK